MLRLSCFHLRKKGVCFFKKGDSDFGAYFLK